MRHVRKYKRLAKADSPMAGSTAQVKPPIITKRARSVVDALFTHFEKWQPQVIATVKIELEEGNSDGE